MFATIFTLQALIIAGGYGTGVEFAQFFLILGPMPGLISFTLALLIFTTTTCLSYSFAIKNQCYCPQSFFARLLKNYSQAFLYVYNTLLFVILCVVLSAIDECLTKNSTTGTGNFLSLALVYALIFATAQKGAMILKKVFITLSSVVTAFYIVLAGTFIYLNASEVAAKLQSFDIGINFLSISKAFSYTGYNLSLVPATLFTLHNVSTKHAVLTGVLASIIAFLPGVFVYLSLVAGFPQNLNDVMPFFSAIESLGFKNLHLGFSVILFFTLFQTAVGIVYNLASNKIQAIALLASAFIVAQVGLINLINYGYGVLTWAVIAFYVFPLSLRTIRRKSI